jgi:hypothetical protein
MKTNYQEGVEPTIDEMKTFSEQYSPEEWALLIKNSFFIKNYDKNLNLVSTAAARILKNLPVYSKTDCY